MIQLLVKLFINRHKKMRHDGPLEEAEERTIYGVVCGWAGVGINICLFGLKYFAGVLSGSVAITADAFNNLSDSGSSIITLLGFRMSAKKPDADHPYGHGRIEYVAGLMVSLLIFLMGFELLKIAVEKIIHPASVETGVVIIVILTTSILVKCYMAFYNYTIGKKINSSALRATAMDSLSDCAATFAVLLAMIVQYFTNWKIDGWIGLIVAGVVLYAAYSTAKDTIQPLLGMPPNQDFVDEVESIVLSHDIVEGIHDLVVHDYGPGRCMISLHAEVAGNKDIFLIHDEIDHIETELNKRLGCESTIHMDPIAMDNKVVNENKEIVEKIVQQLNLEYSIHDFRMVIGPTHTNLIFDVLIPRDEKVDEEELRMHLEMEVRKMNPSYYAVIKIDRSYI